MSPSAQDEPQVVDSAEHLLDLVELNDVVPLSLHADNTGDEDLAEDEYKQELAFQIRNDAENLDVLATVHITTRDAAYAVKLVARYLKSHDFDLSEETKTAFLEKIAIFALWPYIRERVQSLNASLQFKPLVLPMVKQGKFKLRKQDSVDAGKLAEANEGN